MLHLGGSRCPSVVLTTRTESVQYCWVCRGCLEAPQVTPTCRGLHAESLRSVYLFEGLSKRLLDEVVASSGETELQADQWLSFAGEVARHFYLVLTGEIALLRHTEKGDEFIIALLGPGELFGEDLALHEVATEPLSVRALCASRVAIFDRRRLHAMLADEPRLVGRLLETLQRRNAILLDEIERVTVRNASERLLSFLDQQQALGGAAAPRISKRTLAARLSIRPETLSRILGRLKACDQLHEVNGCLYLNGSAGRGASACGQCPVRLWGCPRPGQQQPSATPSAEA